MQILLNGENRWLDAGATLMGLLESLGFEAQRVVVERNGEIVDPGDYPTVSLLPSDRVELVHFVGGG